jgi:hypothetical protein
MLLSGKFVNIDELFIDETEKIMTIFADEDVRII